MMYCSNFARTPSAPLFYRVPTRSRYPKGNNFNPSSLSLHFHPKTPRNDNGSRPTSSSLRFHPKPRNFSSGFLQRALHDSRNVVKPNSWLIGVRGFSTGSIQKAEPLPWIAAYKDREGKRGERRDVAKTGRSSWVDSAESYLSKNGSNRSVESQVKGNESVFVERETKKVSESRENRRNLNAKVDGIGEETAIEEEEDSDPIDDPRWEGIRSKYKRFVDRESRIEKPEVRDWNKQENWGRKVWKEAKESSVPKMVGQGIYGVGPVLAALRVERREFYALYVQEGLDLSGNNRKKDKKGVEKVLKLAEKLGLKVVETSKHDLNMIVDSRPHQGLVLDASPLEMVNIRELESVSMEGKQAPVWVALDEVTDPQNLGAIVRSAYFFGVEGVVLCAKNSAPLSGVVSKASAGSLELIELRSCKNMMQFLSSSVENGWRVLGGSVSSKARPLNEVEVGVPTILVLGSEGSGLRPLVERSCTELVRIPGNASVDECTGDDESEGEETVRSGKRQELSSFLAVESLNVSVAAGVLLYHLVGNNSQLGAGKSSTA